MALLLPHDFLYRVAPTVPKSKALSQKRIIDLITPRLLSILDQYKISTDQRVCYWAGQVCQESDQFCTTEEYASGAAYEGRKDLGNIKSGDGKRYKGRGLIMLTGRANYTFAGLKLGLDLIGHPELADDPVNALQISCLFWQTHNLSAVADLDQNDTVAKITKVVNGGLLGLPERKAATERAFAALGYKG